VRRLRALLALALLVTACGRPAQAVDLVPAAAERSREPVRAAGRLTYIAGGQVWEWSDGATRPLTRPGVRYEGAAWSPDGSRLAASEVGDNHSDVWLLDASGARLRQLTRHWSLVSVQDSAWGRKAAWSPSGETLAYVSDLGRSDMSLWLVGAQGSNPRPIYRLGVGSGGLDWPTWSPDGKRIAFTAYPAGPYRPPQIFVLTIASGVVAQLTELKDGAFDPAWSPDGSAIALAGRSEGRTNLIVMKADGSGLLRLTDGRAERAPTWSPDGSEIAYLALNAGSFDVWAVRLSGSAVSEPRALTNKQGADAVSGVSWTE
jgi:TolB protein